MNKCMGFPLLFVSALALGAEVFTGNAPIVCMPQQGHDCLPTEKSCKPLQPESGKDTNLYFNIQTMSLKTPYRYDKLPIASFAYNEKSLVMQGTSLQLVWSATIHRTTGRLTVAIADREGAYVIFGQCKLSE